ncbi:HAD-IA family hydrolase [Candidatus Woesearchaeota archaeon]|nr:HAD-IA family hydrolase [Candidatus Woesearchaeota archaeon]
MKKKAVIFDLWNTLASKKVRTSEILREHFGILDNDYFEKYARVIQVNHWSSLNELAKHFLKKFSLPVLNSNVDFVVKVFEEGINSAEVYPEVKELLEELKPNHKLAILSNTHPFEVINNNWGISNLFDEVVYSFQIKNLKPSINCFNTILNKLNVKPEECIYVDDMHKNLLVAKRLGMKTFASVKELKKNLNKK